jgi:hypothetical protein
MSLGEAYTCTPICRVVLRLELLAAAIGPAGDILYVPFRIAGGRLTGLGPPAAAVAGGCDFAEMNADETLAHTGSVVLAAHAGDIVVLTYDGVTQFPEGSYDELLEGRLPSRGPSRLGVRTKSTNASWRSLNRMPLLGVGWFDGETTTLDVTLLAIAEYAKQN